MTSSVETIRRDARAFLVGRTGTGKTTLARHLLAPRQRILVIDPKADWRKPIWGEWRVTRDPERAAQWVRRGLVIYRPAPEALADIGHYDRLLWAAFKLGDITILVDEAAMVVGGANSYPASYQAIYQQGRGRNVAAISLTQRPARTPVFLRSEADDVYAFALTSPPDVQAVSEVVGREYKLNRPRGHEYYHRRVDADAPTFNRLLLR